MNYLRDRLDKAKLLIEKSYREKDFESLGKLAKRFEPLYRECYGLWEEGNYEDNEIFSYAEYLKSLIFLSFQGLYQYNSKPVGFIDICRREATSAGIKSIV